MITILVPLLFVVAGALVYGLSANPKLAEIGRIMLGAGLLALALYFSGKTVSLG